MDAVLLKTIKSCVGADASVGPEKCCEFAGGFRKNRCILRADRVVRPYKRSFFCLFFQQPGQIGDLLAVVIAIFPHELLDLRDVVRPARGGEGHACGAGHVVPGL